MMLYNAIKKLSDRECGKFECYSGLSNVKLQVPFIVQAWFPTYNSTSANKAVAERFVGDAGGVIMCYDEKFKENSVCCDVSWISVYHEEKEVLFARSISKNYSSFECKVTEEVDNMQWVMLREPITQKTNNMMDKFRNLRSSVNIEEKKVDEAPIRMTKPIPIRCNITCSTDIDDKYNGSFILHASYTKQYTLQHLVNKIILSLEAKYRPTKFVFDEIEEESFTQQRIAKKDETLLKFVSIITFKKNDISKKGLFMKVSVPLYKHNTLTQITCPEMLKENTDDPTYCKIWARLKWQYEYSWDNLNHMQNFQHFKNEFKDKVQCRYGDQCHGFKKVVNGGADLKDLCHMMIFLHPPRRREIKLTDDCGFGEFKVNNEAEQNIKIYEPTGYDKLKYNYDDKHGFLDALEQEVINNGYKYDLCLKCSNDDKKCNHGQDKFSNMKQKYKNGNRDNILKAVFEKLECNRHKMMGSPLNAAEMLSIILYTGIDIFRHLAVQTITILFTIQVERAIGIYVNLNGRGIIRNGYGLIIVYIQR